MASTHRRPGSESAPTGVNDSRAGNDSFDVDRHEAEMQALGTELERVFAQARAAREAAQQARDAAEHTRLAYGETRREPTTNHAPPASRRSLRRSIFRRSRAA